MIPVLAVPVLVPGRVEAMLASIDVPVGQTVVIAQGVSIAGAINLPHNIGVAAAWNLALKVTPDSPWWFITNDDIVYAAGDLARLVDAMRDAAPRVVTLDGFAAFGITRAALERVGYFDENFVPAYVEDCDYEYRCKLAGVPIVQIPSGLRHDRSSTIADPHYAAQNNRTYPANVAYFVAKWGGPLRGGETYVTPFAQGDDPSMWIGDPRRRRDLDWSAQLPLERNLRSSGRARKVA